MSKAKRAQQQFLAGLGTFAMFRLFDVAVPGLGVAAELGFGEKAQENVSEILKAVSKGWLNDDIKRAGQEPY